MKTSHLKVLFISALFVGFIFLLLSGCSKKKTQPPIVIKYASFYIERSKDNLNELEPVESYIWNHVQQYEMYDDDSSAICESKSYTAEEETLG